MLSIALASLPLALSALKIDDTHYRFCIMDDATITNYSAVAADNSGQLTPFLNANWYSHNGVKIKGTLTTATYSQYVKSVDVFMTETYSGAYPSLYHYWKKGYNGAVYDQTTKFYITVDAPTGVELSNVPSKMLIGDEATIKVSLLGSYTSFSGGGYFSYTYSSSNTDVASITSGKITANNIGTATITVKAYAKNSNYSGSYYIGSASANVEVVDNMDPTELTLNQTELTLNVGETEKIDAIITPSDARTTITWVSSDAEVATVDDGSVKAEGRGNAVIEAHTHNGLSAKCYVKVLSNEDYKDVLIGSLYYDIDYAAGTADVVGYYSNGGSAVSDNIEVPEKISFYGNEYVVKAVGENAFNKCNATYVTLPSAVVTIGDYAFAESQIKDVELPQGLAAIGNRAFYKSKLESLVVGSNLSSLGCGVFAGCDNLSAIYIDEDNDYFSIYGKCLYNRSKTELYYVPMHSLSIDFSDKIEEIKGEACMFNDNLAEMLFPATLVSIGDSAFSDCCNLSKLTFSNSLQEVGNFAFKNCNNIKEVILGNKLSIIGREAFESPNLQKVRISALIPPTADGSSFQNYNATLIVPNGRVAVYRKDAIWGKFKDILDESQAGVDEVVADDYPNGAISEPTYNLLGIPVGESYRGIVIKHDGKKIMR